MRPALGRKSFVGDWINRDTGWVQRTPVKKQNFRAGKYGLRGYGIELDHVAQAISSSRWILDLREDWDDAGGLAIKQATWQRAVCFLENHAIWLWTCFGIIIEAPKIKPVPDGSIDIHWKTSSYELLLNVPDDPEEKASFYGDDRRGICIRGTLDTAAYNQGLLVWFKK